MSPPSGPDGIAMKAVLNSAEQPPNSAPSSVAEQEPPPPPPPILESSVETITRPLKRRKISTACEPCRGRKIRCDGGRPTCGPCNYRGRAGHQACLYSKDADNYGAERTSNAAGLTNRTHNSDYAIPHSAAPSAASQATSQQEVHGGSCSQPPISVRDDQPHHRGVQKLSEAEPQPANHSSMPSSLGRNALVYQADQHTSPINAMGSVSFLDNQGTMQQDTDTQFYGDSSAAHFMKQLRAIVPEARHRQGQSASSSALFTSVEANTSIASALSKGMHTASDLSLPPRDVADSLMENYWVKAHSLYPFVHKLRFTRAYKDIWKPRHEVFHDSEGYDTGLGTPGLSDSRSVVFHCALNAIFALSCQLSVPGMPENEQQSMSQTFFLRSKSLLHVDLFDHGSVALVQTLLIVAQYLQSTSFPSRCWISLGLACRIAQGLGLHVESDRIAPRHPSEVEIRRRIWYGCTIMDIVASTTLGRPLMIPCRTIIPLPSASMEDDMIKDWPASISVLSFYVETIKLYLILSKIVSTIYKPWKTQDIGGESQMKETSSDSHFNDSDAIMCLDEELSTFENNLPAILHKIRGVETRASLPQQFQSLIQRQTNVLYARYLHVRILLHRPTFLRFCQKAGKSTRASHAHSGKHFLGDQSLRSTMGRQSSAICIRSSIEIVNLLNASVSKRADGAWWYTTFYICTAGMVLILANSCLQIHQGFSQEEIDTAWNLVPDTLRMLAGRGHPVKHTLDSLSSIHQLFVSDIANKPQSRPSEASSAVPDDILSDSDKIDSHRYSGSAFIPEPSREPSNHVNQVYERPEDVDFSGFQSFIDMATADMNLMPFCLIDDSLWGSPSGNMGL